MENKTYLTIKRSIFIFLTGIVLGGFAVYFFSNQKIEELRRMSRNSDVQANKIIWAQKEMLDNLQYGFEIPSDSIEIEEFRKALIEQNLSSVEVNNMLADYIKNSKEIKPKYN